MSGDGKAGGDVFDGLVVPAICPTGQRTQRLSQSCLWFDVDLVRMRCHRAGVGQRLGKLSRDILVERSTSGDVEQLDTTTNAEHRNVPG